MLLINALKESDEHLTLLTAINVFICHLLMIVCSTDATLNSD